MCGLMNSKVEVRMYAGCGSVVVVVVVVFMRESVQSTDWLSRVPVLVPGTSTTTVYSRSEISR